MLYKKLLAGGMAVAFIVTSGCADLPAPPTNLPESSAPIPLVSSEPQETVSESAQIELQDPRKVSAPPAELPNKPGIYRLNLDTGLYEQLPMTLPADATVADLALAAAGALHLPMRLKEITQQKGMLVVDFEKDALPAMGMGSSGEQAALDSIAMTILRNHLSAEWICYRVNGGAYESGHYSFGIDEPYQPTPLKLVEDTPEEYAKIRAQIPFPGLPSAEDWARLPIESDAMGKELAWALTLIGAPKADVTSAAELDNDFMIKQALSAAPLLNCADYSDQDTSDPLYCPELKAFADPVEDAEMTLREHVDEAARLLYGDSVKLTHRSVMGDKWKWHETEGVYTPPHMGGSITLCAVLEYEKITSKRYRVTCAFVGMGPGGYFDDNGNEITEAEFNNALMTRLPHREMVVQEREEGGFSLVSHRFL